MGGSGRHDGSPPDGRRVVVADPQRPEVRGRGRPGSPGQDEGGGTRSVEPTRMVLGSGEPRVHPAQLLDRGLEAGSDGAERVTPLDDIEVAGGWRWAWFEAAPGRRQVRGRDEGRANGGHGSDGGRRLGRTRRSRRGGTILDGRCRRPQARGGAGRRGSPAPSHIVASDTDPAGDRHGGRGDEQDDGGADGDRSRASAPSEARRQCRSQPGLPADVSGAGRMGDHLAEELPLPIADRDRGQDGHASMTAPGRVGRQVGPGAGTQEWADGRVRRPAGQRQQRLRRRTVKVGRSVEGRRVGSAWASARPRPGASGWRVVGSSITRVSVLASSVGRESSTGVPGLCHGIEELVSTGNGAWAEVGQQGCREGAAGVARRYRLVPSGALLHP